MIDKAPESEPQRVNTSLQSNTAWPCFKARRVTLQVPYKGPEVAIALPGAWDVCVRFLQTADNQHAVCSLPKSCLYEILH